GLLDLELVCSPGNFGAGAPVHPGYLWKLSVLLVPIGEPLHGLFVAWVPRSESVTRFVHHHHPLFPMFFGYYGGRRDHGVILVGLGFRQDLRGFYAPQSEGLELLLE